jgi:hypothetical protein
MPKSSRERSRTYYERQRAKGLRRKEFWVPDTRSPEFARQAHLDSLAIARSPTEAEDQAFVDAISEWNHR